MLLLLAACIPDQKLDPVDSGDDLEADTDTDTDADTDSDADSDTDTDVEPALTDVRVTWNPDAGGTDLALDTRQRLSFTVTATYDDGAEVDVTAGATYTSSDEAVLAFFRPGVGQPLNAGTTAVEVTPSLGDEAPTQLSVTVTVVAAAAGDVSINELLADPGAAADTNGDGVVDPVDDESVELTNASDVTVDLSGVTLWDGDLTTARHTFPEGALLHAGEAWVIFGGGTVDALSAPFVTYVVATNEDVGLQHGVALNNEGDRMTIRAADGSDITTVPYGEDGTNDAIEDASLVLSPEVFGTTYTHHRYAPGATADQSPGTFVDGAAFGGPVSRYRP